MTGARSAVAARIASLLVVPLTSRLHLEGLPGNVRLDAGLRLVLER